MAIDLQKAQQAYAKAREARISAEKNISDVQGHAKFYGTDVFTQAKLAQDGSTLADAKKAEFFADCDASFAGQEKIDNCLQSLRGGGLYS